MIASLAGKCLAAARPLLLVAMLLTAQVVNSEVQTEGSAAATKTPAKRTNQLVLTIDYGDGMQKRFPTIPWKKEMTVFDALRWADKHPRGIEMKVRGKGSTALVIQIDDLKNGAGDGKNNWIFRVNDELADRSCGVFAVKPGDRILWRFEEYK